MCKCIVFPYQQEKIEQENKEKAINTTCIKAVKKGDIELLVYRIEYLEGPEYEVKHLLFDYLT